MKLKLLIIGLSVALSNVGQNVLFSGKITNPTGEEVVLNQYIQEDGKNKTKEIEKAKLEKDGSFLMKLDLEEITEFVFSDGNEQTPILLGPGDDINLTLNTTMFDETIAYTGKGAEKNNAIIDSYMIEEAMDTRFWGYADDDDTLVIFKDITQSFEVLRSVVKDYLSNVKDFEVYGESYYEGLGKKEERIKNSIKSQRAFTLLLEELKGTESIAIKGIGFDGKTLDLSKFKGKTIVIDFWATWCGPCKAEMPAFKELETRYGSDVNFVSIGVFCKEDKWNAMAKELGFVNNIFLDKEATEQIKPWQVNFIPRYVVINKNFKIVDAHAPRPSSGDLEKLIKELNPDI